MTRNHSLPQLRQHRAPARPERACTPCCAETFKNAPRRAAPEAKLGTENPENCVKRRPGRCSALRSAQRVAKTPETFGETVVNCFWQSTGSDPHRLCPESETRMPPAGPEDAPRPTPLGLHAFFFFFLHIFAPATSFGIKSPHNLI